MLELTKVAKKRKKMPELMPIRPNVVVKSPDLLKVLRQFLSAIYLYLNLFKIENDLSHKSVETPTITAVTPNRLRPTSSVNIQKFKTYLLTTYQVFKTYYIIN